MKRILPLSFIAILFVVATAVQAQNKYDIKSGIATLDITTAVAGTQIKMTKVVYFDDYGRKECQETYSKGKLSGVFFCDGKNSFNLNFKKKKAENQGPATNGIGTRIEINSMGTKEDIASGRVKQGSPMTLAGQTCEVIQVGKGGIPTIYGGWHHVLVYMKSSSSGVNTEINAVKLEANAAVPKEKFEIPAGFTIQ